MGTHTNVVAPRHDLCPEGHFLKSLSRHFSLKKFGLRWFPDNFPNPLKTKITEKYNFFKKYEILVDFDIVNAP